MPINNEKFLSECQESYEETERELSKESKILLEIDEKVKGTNVEKSWNQFKELFNDLNNLSGKSYMDDNGDAVKFGVRREKDNSPVISIK